jgi:hypothetical protein
MMPEVIVFKIVYREDIDNVDYSDDVGDSDDV